MGQTMLKTVVSTNDHDWGKKEEELHWEAIDGYCCSSFFGESVLRSFYFVVSPETCRPMLTDDPICGVTLSPLSPVYSLSTEHVKYIYFANGEDF